MCFDTLPLRDCLCILHIAVRDVNMKNLVHTRRIVMPVCAVTALMW